MAKQCFNYLVSMWLFGSEWSGNKWAVSTYNGRCAKNVAGESGFGRFTGVQQHSVWQDWNPEHWSRWPTLASDTSCDVFMSSMSQLLSVTVKKKITDVKLQWEQSIGLQESEERVLLGFMVLLWCLYPRKAKAWTNVSIPSSQQYYAPWLKDRNVQMAQDNE